MALGAPAKEPLPQLGTTAPQGCLSSDCKPQTPEKLLREDPLQSIPFTQPHLNPQARMASQGCGYHNVLLQESCSCDQGKGSISFR